MRGLVWWVGCLVLAVGSLEGSHRDTWQRWTLAALAAGWLMVGLGVAASAARRALARQAQDRLASSLVQQFATETRAKVYAPGETKR